jgi:ATP-dependent DNA helicase RecQ
MHARGFGSPVYLFDKIGAYRIGKCNVSDQAVAKKGGLPADGAINELVRQGYLDRAGDKYPVICCTGKSEELLKGRAHVMLPVPERVTTKRPPAAAMESARAEDTALFLRQKSLRKAIADRIGVPPYVIFPDKSLHEMACARPGDRESFSAISGVGEYKLEKYGPEFMEEIRRG